MGMSPTNWSEHTSPAKNHPEIARKCISQGRSLVRLKRISRKERVKVPRRMSSAKARVNDCYTGKRMNRQALE